MKINLLILVALLPLSTMAQNETESLETVYQKKAFELFGRVAVEDPDNVCFSPLSVQMVMSMVQNGAAGNTLTQMQDALGMTGYGNDEVNAYNKDVEENLTIRPPFNYDPNGWESEEQQRERYESDYPICEMANGIWTRPGTTWKEQFLQIMRDYYNAGIGSVDFTTQEGINEINGWVNDKTHGMIPKVFDKPLSPNLAMLLANTLYFKGSWSNPFDPQQTRFGIFYNADSTSVKILMMRMQDEFRTGKTENFLTLQMNYGKGDFSMTIFLPKADVALPDLTYEEWKHAFDNGTWAYIDLQMPRFEVEDKYDLNSVLQQMGMEDAFRSDLADFSNMRDEPLWIGKVFQCSKIAVDEIGTEAAAVTVVEMYDGMTPENPEEFLIDRPFYFTIENRKTGSVLFVGRVTQLQGTATPQDDIQLSCPDDNHPHAIDLGLPSGTKWACCNVGATTPEGYGGYYAWGETEEKDVYDWNTYMHKDDTEIVEISGLEYDVAHVKWGDDWHIPTQTQQEELKYYCFSIWTTINGINGYMLISKKNGNNIFLPATGFRSEGNLPNVGYYASYWSSTQYPWKNDEAYILFFSDRDGIITRFHNSFVTGLSVRPVCMETSKVISHISPITANNGIYNIFGIKVADSTDDINTLPPGTYIVNGKKMVIK